MMMVTAPPQPAPPSPWRRFCKGENIPTPDAIWKEYNSGCDTLDGSRVGANWGSRVDTLHSAIAVGRTHTPPPPQRMAPTLLQVGVLGTAAIARKNILAIRESGSLQVRAVASRTLQRAQEFAEETGRRAGLAG